MADQEAGVAQGTNAGQHDLQVGEGERAGAALVSVVIPCYNQAHFLGEAIESVLAQTYPHREIVVVDDGSPDNTREVASRYPGVRYVRQENQGLAAARNTGLRHSSGSYLVFLDADDRLLPEALEVGLRQLQIGLPGVVTRGIGRYAQHLVGVEACALRRPGPEVGGRGRHAGWPDAVQRRFGDKQALAVQRLELHERRSPVKEVGQ